MISTSSLGTGRTLTLRISSQAEEGREATTRSCFCRVETEARRKSAICLRLTPEQGGQKLDQQGRESGALHDGCYAIVERIQESAGGKKESISDIHLKRAINETK